MSSESVAAPGFESSPYFEYLFECLKEEMIREIALGTVKAVIVVTLKNKENKLETWVMDFKNKGTLTKVSDGNIPKGDVLLSLKDGDFMRMAHGKSNGQKLFMAGKLKVKGNLMKATSIESLFKDMGPPPAKL
ncbi:Oleate-induced peroxisomal protein POX18 [Candida viswanathii]|uniref:Oleate-induced peroxisomal protein POX18 n=1 Tax=Candida viswanathii TaxID=5486 RepID=A0A367Y5B2_9ASCO|nr:Oleate-induced peroxisomal protein POX18 [Candida viswanathii]